MRKLIWLLAFAPAVWAQLDDNTLTVSASRPLPSLQPDQAVFSVNAITPLSASLDDVLALLAGSGITAANLVNAQESGSSTQTGIPGISPSLQWTFSLTVPIAKLGSTAAALNTASLASTSQISYNVYSQISAAAQASQQCPYPLLVQDAQTQAQKLASISGVNLGPMISISDGSSLTSSGYLAVVLAGNFAQGIPASRLGSFFTAPIAPPPSCTMTVQFAIYALTPAA